MATKLTKKQQTQLTEKLTGIVQKNNALQLRMSTDTSVNELNINQISRELNRIHYRAIGKDLPTVITIPASLTGYEIDGIGSIYGGVLDLSTKTLVSKYFKIDLGTMNWIYDSTWGSTPTFRAATTPAILIVPTGQPANIITPVYQAVPASTLYTGNVDHAIAQNGVYLRVINSDYNTAEDFKSAMAGIYALYEVANPQTYTLNDQQMIQLLDQL